MHLGSMLLLDHDINPRYLLYAKCGAWDTKGQVEDTKKYKMVSENDT